MQARLKAAAAAARNAPPAAGPAPVKGVHGRGHHSRGSSRGSKRSARVTPHKGGGTAGAAAAGAVESKADPRPAAAPAWNSVRQRHNNAEAEEELPFVRKLLPRRMFSYDEVNEEHLELDYTPVTVRRPVDLASPLRVLRHNENCTIKLFVCITMFNEQAMELKASLGGIGENLTTLQEELGIDPQHVAVAVIIDGRAKAHPSVLEFAARDLKIFDKEMLQDRHNSQEVTMHIFERSVLLSKHSSQREYHLPMQLIFAVKEKNGGKLNSHLWFFSAFCKQIKPEYVVLLDCGTIPRERAITKFINEMDINPQLGGVCGEIAVKNGKFYNMLLGAQVFEYKISHVMDKAMESVFGYVASLPGSFCAYRYFAVRGEPLNQYFYVEENSVKQMGAFSANMYLAEDRVLCFELLAKHNRKWTLHYVRGAVADCDVPENILLLMNQRRRWLNGAFFSLVYYMTKFHRFTSDAGHSLVRVTALYLQFFYFLMNMILQWFAVSFLFLTFASVYSDTFSSLPIFGQYCMYIFFLAYAILMLLQVLMGLGGKAADVQKIYWICSMLFGIIMVGAVGMSVFTYVSNSLNSNLLIAIAIAIGANFVCAFVHQEMIPVLMYGLHYMFMVPTFTNMFAVYSFCNMHDISWGTKEGNLQNERRRPRNKGNEGVIAQIETTPSTLIAAVLDRGAASKGKVNIANVTRDLKQRVADDQEAQAKAAVEEILKKERELVAVEFAAFRTRFLSLWLFSNWFLIQYFLMFGYLNFFAYGIMILMVVVGGYKMVGSVLYRIEEILKSMFFWMCYCGCCARLKCRDKLPRRLQCCVCCHDGVPIDRSKRRDIAKRQAEGRRKSRAGLVLIPAATRPAELTASVASSVQESDSESSYSTDTGSGSRGSSGSDSGSYGSSVGDEEESPAQRARRLGKEILMRRVRNKLMAFRALQDGARHKEADINLEDALADATEVAKKAMERPDALEIMVKDKNSAARLREKYGVSMRDFGVHTGLEGNGRPTTADNYHERPDLTARSCDSFAPELALGKEPKRPLPHLRPQDASIFDTKEEPDTQHTAKVKSMPPGRTLAEQLPVIPVRKGMPLASGVPRRGSEVVISAAGDLTARSAASDGPRWIPHMAPRDASDLIEEKPTADAADAKKTVRTPVAAAEPAPEPARSPSPEPVKAKPKKKIAVRKAGAERRNSATVVSNAADLTARSALSDGPKWIPHMVPRDASDLVDDGPPPEEEDKGTKKIVRTPVAEAEPAKPAKPPVPSAGGATATAATPSRTPKRGMPPRTNPPAGRPQSAAELGDASDLTARSATSDGGRKMARMAPRDASDLDQPRAEEADARAVQPVRTPVSATPATRASPRRPRSAEDHGNAGDLSARSAASDGGGGGKLPHLPVRDASDLGPPSEAARSPKSRGSDRSRADRRDSNVSEAPPGEFGSKDGLKTPKSARSVRTDDRRTRSRRGSVTSPRSVISGGRAGGASDGESPRSRHSDRTRSPSPRSDRSPRSERSPRSRGRSRSRSPTPSPR